MIDLTLRAQETLILLEYIYKLRKKPNPIHSVGNFFLLSNMRFAFIP